MIKIAVSSCLLGNKVRFDSGHKHDHFITDELSEYAQFVPFCPEDLAFGHPRPSLRMVQEDQVPKIRSNKDGSDLTDALSAASYRNLKTLNAQPLGGIIFKSKSPSCGLGSAKIYLPNGFAEGKGDGLFAALCKEQFPLLPMEEEGRLNDPWLRENFIMRLFAYDAFETFKATVPDMNALVTFHQSHKFLLQSKDEQAYRAMGRVVGNHKSAETSDIVARYEILFKTAIAKHSSIGKTRNVLEHMAGFLKADLSPVEKSTLHQQIADFAEKIVPLITPLSTILMFAENYSSTYLLGQRFLDPYPKKLALRSDIKSGR